MSNQKPIQPTKTVFRFHRAQKAFGELVKGVRSLDIPPFGSKSGNLTGSALADCVVAHRLLKHNPEVALDPAERKKRTIASVLDYDSSGLSSFDYRDVPQPLRGQLLAAREWLHKHFSKVPRSHSFRAPSGETAITAMGDVSLVSKLDDPEQWQVSLEASKEAASVCYHNVAMKRLVKRRFRQVWGPCTKSVSRKHWEASHGNAFRCFHRMFLDCCGILNVSRMSTVPKNSQTDRPISMEPMWNMVAQLSFAGDLRRVLRERVGFDLETRADLHRSLVRNPIFATIDFSNASNSNWMCVLKWLLPADRKSVV